MSNEITNPNRVLTKEGLSWVWGKVKSALGNKADKADTVLTTTLSRGRKESTTVGTGSIAFGNNVTASGNYSHAEGYETSATSAYSFAEGYYTSASQQAAHAEGISTRAAGSASHVSGRYNVKDTYSNWNEWVSGTSYVVGDKVKRTISSDNIHGYICTTANSDETFTIGNWLEDMYINYAEIIGNGTASVRSNARALDWDGNEYLKGTLYINCNANSSGGTAVGATMVGATSSVAGSAGVVPVPLAGDNFKYLCGDGTWKDIRLAFVDVSFSVSTSDWTSVTESGVTSYYKDISLSSFSSNDAFWIMYDESFYTYAFAGITATAGTNKVTLTTSIIPDGTISGIIRYADLVDLSSIIPAEGSEF